MLLETERDSFGRYRGGAGMDGMYLQTGRLYAPVCGIDGEIRAFQEVKPVTAREREAAFLSAAEDGFAIYHLSGADPVTVAPLARLEKEGKSPLEGGYNLVHVVYTEPGGSDYSTLEACKAVGVLSPGGIMAFKQNGVVTSWYMDQIAYTQMPGLLKNCLKTAEMSVEQNYNQIDGIINNEAPEPTMLKYEDQALYLVDGTTYLHVQTNEDEHIYTRDDCYATYDYALYDKETLRKLDGGQMEIVEDARNDPMQNLQTAVQNILECRTMLGSISVEPVSMSILDALQSAAEQEMQAQVDHTSKPSLRDNLKQCQREIAASQPGDLPGKPHQGQER